MRDRRTLIAADIRHARLQQGFGDGQDSLAVVIAAPLKIVNGSGYPVRVLALVPGN